MVGRVTFGSLFSGIGGLDLGFERAGMTPAYNCENDPAARSILARHWPTVPQYEDVRDVGRYATTRADVLCGGFPCQDLSVAGRREGLDGKRSRLWFEFHRIIAGACPSWVVVENVPGLLSSNSGRDFGTILGGLEDLGYGVAWRVFNSQFFGVPQRRRRVFIVGSLDDWRAPARVLLEPESGTGGFAPSGKTGPSIAAGTLSRALARVGGGDDPGANKGAPLIVAPSDTDTLVFDPTQITSPHNRSNPRPGDPCPTLPARGNPPLAFHATQDPISGVVTPAIPTDKGSIGALDRGRVRRLTPVECERLQGFPDGWTAGQSDAARYRQLGNAVTVNVAEWIGRRIVAVDGA